MSSFKLLKPTSCLVSGTFPTHNHSHDVNGDPHAHFTQNSKQAEDIVHFDLLIVNTTHTPFRVLISQLEGHGYTTDPRDAFTVIQNALSMSYTPWLKTAMGSTLTSASACMIQVFSY
jgi:hypothetical protein